MTIAQWVAVPAGILMLAFIVFAFRQGMQVTSKQEGDPPERYIPWRLLKSDRMKSFRTLDDVDVKGKRVLLRVDLNVPMEDGRVTDATRLERIAPTITEISGKGGKVILLAHFGRPKGRDGKVFAEACCGSARGSPSRSRSRSRMTASAMLRQRLSPR